MDRPTIHNSNKSPLFPNRIISVLAYLTTLPLIILSQKTGDNIILTTEDLLPPEYFYHPLRLENGSYPANTILNDKKELIKLPFTHKLPKNT